MNTFKIGQLLISKSSILRVIGSGNDFIIVIEYSQGSTNEPKYLSCYKDVWYQWKNGVGEKITFTKINTITSPTKIPQQVLNFSQLENEQSFIIKGTPYKVVDKNALSVPDKWAGQRVLYLTGFKKDAMLSLETLERKSHFDKHANCELLVDNNITRLSESDIWVIGE
jgi:hypothetical protein